MDRTTVAQARREESIGKQVLLQGWVRTRRDSKGGFSFLELNDGSCFGSVQIVAEGALANYESEADSRSSGLPCVFGHTPDGTYIIVVYEVVDEDTINPVTAYEVPEP